MNRKISVIVPVYKVEQYLRQCLDSIVNQTYQDLEILLIDDGSPDHCGAICDEYAEKDERIRVLHKQNAGVHAAWNDGLSMASGEWVTFVDSDDWIDTDFYSRLMETPQIETADVVQPIGYYGEKGQKQAIYWAVLEPFQAKGQEERENIIPHVLMRSKTKGKFSAVWGKLFRTSFLHEQNLRFDANIRTGMMGDLIFNWDAIEAASLIIGVKCCGYHYRYTYASNSFKFNPNQAKMQEQIEKQFYDRVEIAGSQEILRKAVDSRCLRDIVNNLRVCYFHSDNPASRHEVAEGIREMKEMPYYKNVIHSLKNPFNGITLKAFQFALKLPWVWPLWVMVTVWDRIDSL